MTDSNPRILERVDLTIIGQRGNEQNADFLSERVSIMLHLEDQIKNVENQALCQVIWAKNKENTFDIFVGYEIIIVESVPIEMEVYQIKSEKMAAFEHTGNSKSLTNFIKSIYDDWLPNSIYSLNNMDFTQIQFVSQTKETNHLLPSKKRIFKWEIWIPIIPLSVLN